MTTHDEARQTAPGGTPTETGGFSSASRVPAADDHPAFLGLENSKRVAKLRENYGLREAQHHAVEKIFRILDEKLYVPNELSSLHPDYAELKKDLVATTGLVNRPIVHLAESHVLWLWRYFSSDDEDLLDDFKALVRAGYFGDHGQLLLDNGEMKRMWDTLIIDHKAEEHALRLEAEREGKRRFAERQAQRRREELGEDRQLREHALGVLDFLAVAASDYEWELPGRIPRQARVILTGGEGAGKSTLFRWLAVCLAIGRDPFTLAEIPRRRVLLIDAENPEALVRIRLASIHGPRISLRSKEASSTTDHV